MGVGKDRANRNKHGLSFVEAQQLLQGDEDYLEIFDAEHSDVEDRFIAIGPLDRGIVVVIHTERDDEVIRIIGARFADERERRLYRSYMDRLT